MTGQDYRTSLLGVAKTWHLKVLALSVAVALWVFVASGETSERSISVPVDYVHIPSGLVLAGAPPRSVLVHLRGRRAALARLSPGDLRVEIDLSGASAGLTAVRFLRDYLRVPRGVTVTAVTPARLELTLTRPGEAPGASDGRGVAMDTEQPR
jgi:YbbR domain-containing protein